mgnify:CR=1 FL=1
MSWKDILKEEIKHYKELPKDMPDATENDFAVDEGEEKSRLAFAKEILEEKFSNKTHKIISYNNPYDQMFYRIIER